MRSVCTLIVLASLGVPLRSGGAVEHLSILQNGRAQKISGRIVVEAADGGLLLLDPANVLWDVQPAEIRQRESDEQAFAMWPKEQMRERLMAELPAGFRTHETAHYLIGYNTSPTYAEWCGALYERLYSAFTNYWKTRGFTVREPAGPLVALVFADRGSYNQYAKGELGEATNSIIGYYSLRTNRVTMYDLTGLDELTGGKGRATSAAHINRILARPEAERNVATIIHEATHQVAFNCGLQTRYADNPLWVSEGIAVWFETPDLSNSKGWRNVGGKNQTRLTDFARYLKRRPPDSLKTLLSTDDRFRDPNKALDAYAEAWALNYYLFKRHGKSYLEYLKYLAGKKPLMYDTPEERLAQFEAHFGKEWDKLDADFLKYFLDSR